MPRKSLAHLECSVANTAQVMGDTWTVLILRDAFQGVRRFDHFVERLGIARNTLADRLERMVANGLLRTEVYQEHPPRHEYRLTDKGRDLFDVLMTLWSFGEKWNPPSITDYQKAIHLECGNKADAVAHCGHCGGRLTRRNVVIEPPVDPSLTVTMLESTV